MTNVELEPKLDIVMYDDVRIERYSPFRKADVENFISIAIDEGNDSYKTSNFHPDTINGQTWLTLVGDEIASISAVERSHYTGDPEIAGRICRYHILKKFRHSNAGFKMLEDQVTWGKEHDLKVLYWTHNVNNKALNALYQHKRTMPFRGGSVPYFMTETYRAFRLQTDMIFRVSMKSDFLQYVYANVLDPSYEWKPTHWSIIYHEHDGDIGPEIARKVLG